MAESLIFLVHTSPTGSGITVSPRLTPGNIMPLHAPSVNVTQLPGTGQRNGRLHASVRCSNCRAWQRGQAHPTSRAARFIFARGPPGVIDSASLDANITFHGLNKGFFAMDLTRAVADSQAPLFEGIGGVREMKGPSSVKRTLHGIIMILVFFLFLPLGIVLLRMYRMVNGHSINQSLALGGSIVGMALGINISKTYEEVSCPDARREREGESVLIQDRRGSSTTRIRSLVSSSCRCWYCRLFWAPSTSTYVRRNEHREALAAGTPGSDV